MLRRLVPSGRRHPAAISAFILTASLLALAACKPPSDRTVGGANSSLSASIELSSVPRIGEAPLTVRVLDAGEAVSGATVRVVGDMTHAGMQPVLSDAVEDHPGEYRADDFIFTMAGDWIITATITTADGRRVSAELFTNVPSR